MKDRAIEVYNAMMAKDYFSQWMGIEPILMEEGHCILRMSVRQDMLNGYGILHGGLAFSLADSAFAFASNSYGRIALSINGLISYNESAKDGDVLLAEAVALHVSYKIAEFDVNIKSEENQKIYYRFRGMVYRSSKDVIETLRP